jgi:hypothetical protein
MKHTSHSEQRERGARLSADLPSQRPSTWDEATKVAVAGAFTMAASLGVDRFVYTPLLPMMQEALRFSAGQAGLLASANFAGYLAGALLASVLRMPGDRRAWLVAALAVSAVATIAMSSWPFMPLFVAIRFIGGTAGAFAVVIATAMTVEASTSTGRSGLMALHFAGGWDRNRCLRNARVAPVAARRKLARGMAREWDAVRQLCGRGRISDFGANGPASDCVGSASRQSEWIVLAVGRRERALGFRLCDDRDLPRGDGKKNARDQLS